MAFVIKKIQQEDLDRLYPDSEADKIKRFTYPKDKYPAVRGGWTWAIDDEQNVFLTQLPIKSRDDYIWKYLFGCDGGIAVIKKERYCLFSFLYLSPSLIHRIDEVKILIRDAFKSAGELIDGTTDENNDLAVPHAEFVPLSQEGR